MASIPNQNSQSMEDMFMSSSNSSQPDFIFSFPRETGNSSSTSGSSGTSSAVFMSTSTIASSFSNTSLCSSMGREKRNSSVLLLSHGIKEEEDSDMLFNDFSQDLDDLEQAAPAGEAAAALQDPFALSHNAHSQASRSSVPDLLLDEDDSHSASSTHDDPVDHELEGNPLGLSQEDHQQSSLSQASVEDLPRIKNRELEAALEALNLYEHVGFPSGASSSQRRDIVKEKLCDYATSMIIQLTLSTTSDHVSSESVDNDGMPEESQYRMLQAKIAKREPRPAHCPLELKLRNRHGQPNATEYRTIRFPATLASTRQLTIILKLLDLLTDCLAGETPSTLRDIYYRDVKLFGSQKVVDTLVDHIAATLGVRRRDLNVVAASKGLVHGHLQLRNDQGHDLDCSAGSGSTGHLIPPNETILSLKVDPEVRFVLVVEKEAVFQTLCSWGFTNDAILGKSILVTGKGYPDVATRELVKALSDQLPSNIPILCFVDGDPHGLHIFLNYRNGSKAMSFDRTNLVAPKLQWIGLSAEDMLR
ncbi:DNA topoisomerase IV, alpha subunit [Cystobasidium minutum MCA 4210]|uniref:DNA topoisomerase IV, alpha subunit n=1 Tax=Cystobasidium minutum MCA 4210 TaxID=1397322 RepID=UPI0034CEF753|eukprot:jgi/Rhomi1/195538/gm1.3752_g